MRIAAVLLLAIVLLTGIAQAEGLGPAQGLNPDQIQAIRAIGRSVLAAKKARPVDPALSELRQGVEELRSLTKEGLGPLTPSQGMAEIHSLIPSETPMNSQNRAEEDYRADDSRAVLKEKSRASLARIGERRSRAQAMLADRQAAPDDQRQMALEAADKLAALERDMDDVLAMQPEERVQGLARLRQRLEPKRMRDMQLDGDAPALQPTLTTRVTHAMPVRTTPASQATEPPAKPKRLKVIKPKVKRRQ